MHLQEKLLRGGDQQMMARESPSSRLPVNREAAITRPQLPVSGWFNDRTPLSSSENPGTQLYLSLVLLYNAAQIYDS